MLDLTAMKWFKKQRENPDKVEAFAFADPEFWKNVDEQVLDIAMDNARRKLESQMDAYHQIVNTSGTLLGWLVGAFISLSAAIVAMSPGGWTNALIMAIYWLASVVTPFCIIVFRIHFRQNVISPGMRPRLGLNEHTCSQIMRYESGIQQRAYKVVLLFGMQRDIDYNSDQNYARIKAYRAAVCVLGCELAAGVPLYIAISCPC